MPAAKITGQGLTAIGFCVALLWTYLIGTQLLARRAVDEQVKMLQQIRKPRKQPSPAPAQLPKPFPARRLPVASA